LITRILTVVIGLPVFILLVNFGGWPLALLCMAISLIGQRELYLAFDKKDKPIHGAGYMFTAAHYLLILYGGAGLHVLVGMAFFVVLIQACMAMFFRHLTLQECISTLFGFFYMPFLFSFVFLVRGLEGGQYYVWLIFTATFGCDTFAYFAGITLGKHKLVNTPSPKKSVEGIVGGVLGAALVGFLYGWWVKEITVGVAVAISVLGAMLSVMGDMSASAVKRHTGIKDSGSIIPGHGGVLDRFDSALFVAPMVYLVLVLGVVRA
jgi:phosphatidate cytidylyltransferase